MPNLKDYAEIEVKIRCRQCPSTELKSLGDLLQHCMTQHQIPIPSQWETQEVLMQAITNGKFP